MEMPAPLTPKARMSRARQIEAGRYRSNALPLIGALLALGLDPRVKPGHDN
ncbi:MAG: hypothetical protein ACLPX9_06030 [Rhodomicrobium sp.]